MWLSAGVSTQASAALALLARWRVQLANQVSASTQVVQMITGVCSALWALDDTTRMATLQADVQQDHVDIRHPHAQPRGGHARAAQEEESASKKKGGPKSAANRLAQLKTKRSGKKHLQPVSRKPKGKQMKRKKGR